MWFRYLYERNSDTDIPVDRREPLFYHVSDRGKEVYELFLQGGG